MGQRRVRWRPITRICSSVRVGSRDIFRHSQKSLRALARRSQAAVRHLTGGSLSGCAALHAMPVAVSPTVPDLAPAAGAHAPPRDDGDKHEGNDQTDENEHVRPFATTRPLLSQLVQDGQGGNSCASVPAVRRGPCQRLAGGDCVRLAIGKGVFDASASAAAVHARLSAMRETFPFGSLSFRAADDQIGMRLLSGTHACPAVPA